MLYSDCKETVVFQTKVFVPVPNATRLNNFFKVDVFTLVNYEMTAITKQPNKTEFNWIYA